MTAEEIVEFVKNPRAPMPRVFPTPISADDERRLRDLAAFLMQWQ